MCERVREVVAGKSAPVRRHREAVLVIEAIRVSVGLNDFVIVRGVDETTKNLGCSDEACHGLGVSQSYSSASGVVITMGCGSCMSGVGRATAVTCVGRAR